MPSWKGASRTSASSRAGREHVQGFEPRGKALVTDQPLASRRIRLNPALDKSFLFVDERDLSFAEVSHLASRTCQVILEQVDIKPGDKVGILMPNGLPFVLTVLALMRLRAVSVPLNTRLTASELTWQVANANCRLVVCTPETRPKVDEIGINVIELPPIRVKESASDMHEFGFMDLDDDFAIIHTSGTSGRPKAAILTYGNIYHSAVASAKKLGKMQDERWLCVLPLYHVGGLSIIMRSLIYGTAVELIRSASFDVEMVNHALSNKPISLVSLVPTMLGRLLDAKTRAWNPHLRLILLGGEAPSEALVGRCIADGLPIATSYGLTEASSQVATALPELVYRKPGTVGKTLGLMQARIIDKRSEDVPANVPGEVLVKGGAVMRGYTNDRRATDTALQDGWLHTGDIGYLDEDGDLFIMQRRADLIVSGGENVYPAEVEAVLRRHPVVAEAVVFGLPDAEWGQRVAAVLELHEGASISFEDIRAFARQHLAAYKLPRQFAVVDALPRTASSKIQRGNARKVFDDAISSRH